MNRTEIIEKYLKGELKGSDLTNFENQLKTDKTLADEIRLHKDIDDTLKEKEIVEFHSKLEVIHKKLESEGKLKSKAYDNRKSLYIFNFRWYYAAAGIALLLGFAALIYFMMKPSLTEKLYSEYFSPYDAACIVRSGGEKESNKLQLAFEQYNSGNYEKSWQMYKEASITEQSNMTVFFFRGISAMEINNIDDAIFSFRNIINNNTTLYCEPSEWYLSLCYIKKNDRGSAISILKKLVSKKTFYSSKAELILKELSEK